MISITKTFPLLVAPILLSGCSLLATLEDAQAIEEVVNDLPNYTDATSSNIPTTGNANFDGHLAVGDTNAEFILADLNAEADFAANTFDGAASQIRLIDGTAENPLQAIKENFSGTVPCTGTITGTTVASSGSGSISASGTDYTLSFTANGDFYVNGDGKLTMASEDGVTGSLTPAGGTETPYPTGAFYAAEQ